VQAVKDALQLQIDGSNIGRQLSTLLLFVVCNELLPLQAQGSDAITQRQTCMLKSMRDINA
jgi:hypothetical protein